MVAVQVLRVGVPAEVAPAVDFRGKKVDPVDLAKEWKRKLAKEMRLIDREISNIKREEDRAMKECKALVKANRLSAAKILAKQVAQTRKAVERMYVTKAQLNSVSNNLQTSVCKLFFPCYFSYQQSYLPSLPSS